MAKSQDMPKPKGTLLAWRTGETSAARKGSGKAIFRKVKPQADAETSPVHEEPSISTKGTKRRISGANISVSTRVTRSSPTKVMEIKPITPTKTPKPARTPKRESAPVTDDTNIRRSSRKVANPSRLVTPLTARKSPVKDDAGSSTQLSPTNAIHSHASKSPTKRGRHLLSPELSSTSSKGLSALKKRRTDTFLGELDEVIPPSHSDEVELSPVPLRFKLDVKRVDLSDSIQLPPPRTSSPPISSSDLGTLTPSEETDSEDEENDKWKTLTQPLDSELLEEPASLVTDSRASPEHLGTDTKTARTIAEIKARALAAVPETSDNDEADVPEDLQLPSLDSSDDDIEMILPKPSSKTASRTPAKRTPTSSSRYGLRDRRRVVTQSGPSTAKPSAPRQRNATANPLVSLLREKRAAERRGGGSDLFAAADMAISRNSSTSFADDENGRSDDDISPHRLRFGEAVQVSDLPAERMRTPEPRQQSDDMIMQSGDRKRILGEDHDEALGNLLKEAIRLQPLFVEEVVGVPFWPTHNDYIKGEEEQTLALPSFEIEDLDGPLHTLSSTVRDQDHLMVQMLLDAGLLHITTPEQLTTLLPWCASTILSVDCPDEVAVAIVDALATRLYHQQLPGACLLSAVMDAVVLLRPIKSALISAGWLDESAATQTVWDQPCDTERRNIILHRLTSFVHTCCSARAIAVEDLPNLLFLLLKIGMDPTLPLDIRLAVMNTIGSMEPCITNEDAEAPIAFRILSFARGLTLVNQAHLFDILAARVPSHLHRVIRWIAYTLLFPDVGPAYEPVPPLNKLNELLQSPDGGFGIDDDTDFGDYCHRVTILSFALTGLEDYVTPSAPNVAAKLGEIPAIRTTLDRIHGFIDDTHATNLEGSNAKAALLNLSMRLKYHSNALASIRTGGPGRKPRPITDFFPNPPNPTA